MKIRVAQRKLSRRRPLAIEPLEPRCLLALVTSTWTAPGGGNYVGAGNWSTGVVPDNNNLTGDVYQVELSAGGIHAIDFPADPNSHTVLGLKVTDGWYVLNSPKHQYVLKGVELSTLLINGLSPVLVLQGTRDFLFNNLESTNAFIGKTAYGRLQMLDQNWLDNGNVILGANASSKGELWPTNSRIGIERSLKVGPQGDGILRLDGAVIGAKLDVVLGGDNQSENSAGTATVTLTNP